MTFANFSHFAVNVLHKVLDNTSTKVFGHLIPVSLEFFQRSGRMIFFSQISLYQDPKFFDWTNLWTVWWIVLFAHKVIFFSGVPLKDRLSIMTASQVRPKQSLTVMLSYEGQQSLLQALLLLDFCI